MNRFFPEQLQVWTQGTWLTAPTAPTVNGFSNDTRTLASGNCFVALRTGQRDGHDFLDAAEQAGAVAALVSRPVPSSPLPQLLVPDDTLAALQRIAHQWRLGYAPPVIGVTGSVGKTSTKDMLAAMLGEAGFATKANLNNLLGVPLMLLGIEPERHTAGAVIEAGMSEPGELERAAWIIEPDVAVVTNVQPAHLAGLGSMEAIAQEKSALVRRMRAGGVAVFPASCLGYAPFQALTGRTAPVVFPGEVLPDGGRHERVFRVEFAESAGGREIRLADADGGAVVQFFFPQSTVGMARNASLAAVAASLAGVSGERIQAAFNAWKPSARRGEVREHEGRLFYVDCYNASPASVLDAAQAFDVRTGGIGAVGGRLFLLAGMNELGAESVALHREVGRRLPLRDGDVLGLFGGDSAAFGEGAVAAGFPAASVQVLATIDAVREAVASARGAVLLKGSRSYALERTLPWAK
ncbi:MAG: UDP-N-acetylmuramoyl-tripeptide--D-alanyl-D-alanine ligase [Puniceicoccales bacterium]|jgi:UDP-N-acetylmuramoyl-tripeptide--D-alanyl-D-alanine ligase|nr:UDP-N-acetylmuramoyl-tripeptide--D-alanyl-D-alanine ligase [Puniceicoccales bacterium]